MHLLIFESFYFNYFEDFNQPTLLFGLRGFVNSIFRSFARQTLSNCRGAFGFDYGTYTDRYTADGD